MPLYSLHIVQVTNVLLWAQCIIILFYFYLGDTFMYNSFLSDKAFYKNQGGKAYSINSIGKIAHPFGKP